MDKETETNRVTLDDVKDFSNVCRICATITDFVIPIFIGEGVQNKLAEKIRKHLPIQLSEQDLLPHVLCYQCANTLLAWHELVKCCVQADAALHQRVAVLGHSVDAKATNEIESQSTESRSQNKSKFKNTPESDVLSLETSENTNTKLCYFCNIEQPLTLYKEHMTSMHNDRLLNYDEYDDFNKKLVLNTSLHADTRADDKVEEKEKIFEKGIKNKANKTKYIYKKQNAGTKVTKRERNVKLGRRRVVTRKSKFLKTKPIIQDEFSDHDTDYFDQLPLSVFEAIEDSQNGHADNESVLELQADSSIDNNIHSIDETSANSQPVSASEAESQLFHTSDIEPQTVDDPQIFETSEVESDNSNLLRADPGTLSPTAAVILENQPRTLDSSSAIIMEHQLDTFDAHNAVLLGHEPHTFDRSTNVFMPEQTHTFDARTTVFMRHQPHTMETGNAVIMGHQPHTFDASSAFIMRPQLNNLDASNAVIMIHQPHPFDTSGAVIMRPHLNTLDTSNAVIMIHQPQSFDTGNALIMSHPPHNLDTSNALITIHQPHTMDASNAVIAIHQPHILETSEAVTVEHEPHTWGNGDAVTESQQLNTSDTNQVETVELLPVTEDSPVETCQMSPADTSDDTTETNKPAVLTTVTANKLTGKKKERTCPVCSKLFTASSSYFYHIKHSHNNRRQDYECDICKGKFGSKKSLQEHSIIHLGLYPYQCIECQKKFRSRASLYIHKQIHIGTKEHACLQCDKAFRWRTQLSRHVLRHEAEKGHVCAKCGRGFTIHGDLLRHARTHDAGTYECDKCDNTYSQKRYLKEHIIRKHSTKT